MTSQSTAVGRAEILAVFLKIGLLSFGGPAAQIALMHRMLVDERGWLSERQFLNALSFCMLLPGPEAMQLATYAGWRLGGVIGGLVAGLLFVLPGAAVIFALAGLYVAFGTVPLVDTLFLGVQAAAVVIVVEALLRVSKRALGDGGGWAVAGLAFVAIFFFAVPYPLIVIAAATYGALRATPGDATAAPPVEVSATATLRVIVFGLAVWALPLALLAAFAAPPILTELGVFFSKLAVVTFGGAYAVLAYMAQEVVVGFGWLGAEEMLDGLGLAETTPGPLILVTQFVGFLAAHAEGGYALAVLGGAVTLWVTFVPCFLWIFAGAPYIEWISAQPRLSGALRGITAAVVGVIFNLSLWFALHVLFAEVAQNRVWPLVLWTPDPASLKPDAVILVAFAAYLLLKRHMGIVPVLGLSALAAFGLSLV